MKRSRPARGGQVVLAIREVFFSRRLARDLSAEGLGTLVCTRAREALDHLITDFPSMLITDRELWEHASARLTADLYRTAKASGLPIIELVDDLNG